MVMAKKNQGYLYVSNSCCNLAVQQHQPQSYTLLTSTLNVDQQQLLMDLLSTAGKLAVRGEKGGGGGYFLLGHWILTLLCRATSTITT